VSAQWVTDGVAICVASGNQYRPAIASDDSGGAIVTWQDSRSGNWDIYAQLINESGNVQWAVDGVIICAATDRQEAPAVASEGSGGAIITWHDRRNGTDYDIYAQRVDGSGIVQWTGNGVAICTASNNQSYPTIIPDGSGGAIIMWEDNRIGDYPDIYTQRVDGSGNVQWTADGVAVGAASDDQNDATIASDGSGGVIITWQNYRVGDHDIFAQRVDASGNVRWTAGGVVICAASGIQTNPTITPDGSGGAIVTWRDERGGATNGDIYAQCVDASGNVQWTADGVAICATSDDQEYPIICSDGLGGAIITWRDDRSGTSLDIYTQRVDGSGSVQWTADGVAICTAPDHQTASEIVYDGSEGAIITWEDNRSGGCDIYAQHTPACDVTPTSLDYGTVFISY
jgi:hypothetical protein